MGSKERRERERQATQQGILQAALEIVTEENWQALTIRRIAERIEYSPSAIYKYFEDKEAILLALVRQGFAELLASLEHITKQGHDPCICLQDVTMSYWNFARSHPTLYQLMYELQGTLHEIAEAKAAFLLLRTLLETWSQAQQVQLADPDGAVNVLWASMHGMVVLDMAHYVDGGPVRAQKLLAQTVSDLLLAWQTRG